MLVARNLWVLRESEKPAVAALASALSVSPRVAGWLVQRGITDVKEAASFLDPQLQDLHDPYLMLGMEATVQRIRQAVADQEQVLIYGDYDVDGITSVALLKLVLRELGLTQVTTYIPHRVQEGYGLRSEPLVAALETGVSLVITVDTGITAVEEAELLADLGVDLLITDHHQPLPGLPTAAAAILNPKQPDCTYPFPDLCGVGVVCKLATALLGRVPEEHLDLVALGTVADLMPLRGENRILVTQGLQRLGERPGLAALLRLGNIAKTQEVTAEHIAFVLAPRLNAPGRLDHADTALALLLAETPAEARPLAQALEKWNEKRRELVAEQVATAMATIDQNPALHADGIVLADPSFHTGVVGIVAAQLVEQYGCPAIVLAVTDAGAAGSGRSVVGFDLHAALVPHEALFTRWGGHAQAAGMHLPEDQVEALREALQAAFRTVRLTLPERPDRPVDAKLQLGDFNESLWQDVQSLAPYGSGNPAPRFWVYGAQMMRCEALGKTGLHVRMTFQQAGESRQALAFRKGHWMEEVMPGAEMELLAQWVVNIWRGRRSLQLQIEDATIGHVQIFDWRKQQPPAALEALYQDANAIWLGTPPAALRAQQELPPSTPWETAVVGTAQRVICWEPPPSWEIWQTCWQEAAQVERIYLAWGTAPQPVLLPGRSHFTTIYKLIEKQPGISTPSLAQKMGQSQAVVEFLVQVFQQVGLLARATDGYHLADPMPTGKQDLTKAPLYRLWEERYQVWKQCMQYSYERLCKLVYAELASPQRPQAGPPES